MNHKKLLLIFILTMQILFATGIEEELNYGDVINKSIVQKEKQYFKIKVPKNRSIRVDLSNLSADIDLYVKRDKLPTIRSNDCYSSNSNRKNEECILNNTDKESPYYYILVYGFKTANYQLSVSVEELEKIPVLSHEEIQDSVKKGESKNYKIPAKKGDIIKVRLYHLTSDADLRLKIGRKANRHTFDCKSTNGVTRDEICHITLKEDDDVYVQVDGYRSANYSLSLVTATDNNFPKKLLNGNTHPEDGVYVKYTKDKTKAYIFIDEKSSYFQKHKGVTAVDISDKEHPVIIMHTSTVYSNPFNYHCYSKKCKNFYITENGDILLFTYMNNYNQYMGTLNLNTLEPVDNILLTHGGWGAPAPLFKTNTNVDLFFTIHDTPEQSLYTYYYVSDVGDINKISGIDAGGSDYHYIWEQGPIGQDKYFITYLNEHASGNTQYLKFTKKIYDINNLPDMPLIDTIVTEEERPI